MDPSRFRSRAEEQTLAGCSSDVILPETFWSYRPGPSLVLPLLSAWFGQSGTRSHVGFVKVQVQTENTNDTPGLQAGGLGPTTFRDRAAPERAHADLNVAKGGDLLLHLQPCTNNVSGLSAEPPPPTHPPPKRSGLPGRTEPDPWRYSGGRLTPFEHGGGQQQRLQVQGHLGRLHRLLAPAQGPKLRPGRFLSEPSAAEAAALLSQRPVEHTLPLQAPTLHPPPPTPSNTA